MKLFPILITLTAFVAAHEGPHDAQGNHLDAQGNIITFSNGTKPAYPIPPTKGGNKSSGNQGGNQYPTPKKQGDNNSSGSQGGKQIQNPYPTPVLSKLSGGNQATMDEFQKFLQSPFMKKFMEYMKQNAQKY